MSYDSHEVARLDIELFKELVLLLFREIFEEGGGNSVLCHLCPGETLCPVCLDIFAEGVYLLAAENICKTLKVYGHNRAALFQSALKGSKTAAFYRIRNIGQLKAETHIGLVRAETAHGLMIAHAEYRGLYIYIYCLFEDTLYKALLNGDYIVHIYKGHLKVDLCKLGLTVGAEVFVSETSCQLHIAVDARKHEHLLVLLGRLGQGVKAARMDTGGHKVVSRSLGCGLCQHGGLYLQKALFIEIISRYHCRLVAHPENALERGAAQIEIAVFKAEHFAYIYIVVDLKGRCLGLCKDLECVGKNLHLACGNVGIYRGAHTDDTLYGDDPFHSHVLRPFGQSGVDGAVKDALHDARAVSHIGEDKAAEIAVSRNPAVYSHAASYVAFSHGAAVAAVCAVIHISILRKIVSCPAGSVSTYL